MGKELFGYDAGKSATKLGNQLPNFIEGFLSLPINIPGTNFHKCIKSMKIITGMVGGLLEERRRSSPRGLSSKQDFMDDLIQDLGKEDFWTDEFTVRLIFGLSLASFDSIPRVVAVAVKFLSDHPSAILKLVEEHEAILEKRGGKNNSTISWVEYRSMTYTRCVIRESLRLTSVVPVLLRKALTDIQAHGYTIPKGWGILISKVNTHFNPTTFQDPFEFNPSRWENMSEAARAKNFMPFGEASKTCPGAEFSNAFMAVFLHVLVTKYRFEKIKGGDIVRSPFMGFLDGFHVQFQAKAEKE